MRCAWLVMVGSDVMRRAATLSSASIRSATPARQEPPPVSTMLRICEASEANQGGSKVVVARGGEGVAGVWQGVWQAGGMRGVHTTALLYSLWRHQLLVQLRLGELQGVAHHLVQGVELLRAARRGARPLEEVLGQAEALLPNGDDLPVR